MFAPFAEVPGYPLVFIVFWGAAAFFLLAMARHLRVFAVARPSHPFNRLPTRFVSLVEYAFVQTKMFKDAQGRPDARRHLLGLRAADDRDGQHRHRRDHPAGPVDPVRRPVLGADQRDAERRRGHRPGLDRLGVLPAAGLETAPADVQPGRAADPRDDRRRGRDRAVRAGLRGRGARRDPRRVRVERPGRPAQRASRRRRSKSASRSSGGRTSRSSPRSCATCRSASTSTSRRPSRTSSSASSSRAASCRSSISRTRTPRSGSRRSRTSAGRTCSTASPAPNAVAARRPARPRTPASRSTPRR